MSIGIAVAVLLALSATGVVSAANTPDETPPQQGEWGFRPAEGEIVDRTPPPFVWRPQKGAQSYALQVASNRNFAPLLYERRGIKLNCLCPERAFDPGEYWWRFAFIDEEGQQSAWSTVRRFEIAENAVPFPRPMDNDLFARIPDHPRLFLRPEDLPKLREQAQGELRERYEELVAECEKLLAKPPDVSEPPTYPAGMERLSLEWLDMWWGNRRRVEAVTNGAAMLAFTYQLGGDKRYAAEARRLLLAACAWDPKGSTGFRYNDEAGMPFMYYVSRAYTWLHDYLSEEDRQTVRQVMRVRGAETYNLLHPNHIWRPYSSHSNRSWHFLGEMGIAFYGELPEAADWISFAIDVFFCVYPVWSDADGGWHEGASYWNSYLYRQTWWLDVQQAAFGIDGYKRPFFKRVGDFALYNVPPGVEDGGFGDLSESVRPQGLARLMAIFARKTGNPYWQWYVDESGGAQEESGYIGFLRATSARPEPKAPIDLASSRHFRGTGYAALHTNLVEREKDVQVLFKASPFGTYSHGYESQNTFLLTAYGKPLLIRTGHRDGYGSQHHRNWQWQTRSVNSILVNGEGQIAHSFSPGGRIVQFFTSTAFDYVAGDATEAYLGKLERFVRHILLVKPEGAVLIYDELKAPQPATFQWLLHAWNKFRVGENSCSTENGGAAVQVTWLSPRPLSISQTNEFDPPPRDIKLVQWHLTAATNAPAEEVHFVTVLQPYRTESATPQPPNLAEVEGGWIVTIPSEDARVEIAVRRTGVKLRHRGNEVVGPLAAWRLEGEEIKAYCQLQAE